MRKYKTSEELGYHELFDKVCLEINSKHYPKTDEERELINEVIKATISLSISYDYE